VPIAVNGETSRDMHAEGSMWGMGTQRLWLLNARGCSLGKKRRTADRLHCTVLYSAVRSQRIGENWGKR